MGMAASQARYLALIARQSNVEYEGQQINQARLALTTKSSNAFRTLLDMQAPTYPNRQDYIKIIYTWDGDAGVKYTMKSWQKLVNDPEGYNYTIKYTSNAPTPQGYKVDKSNPQVKFNSDSVTDMKAELQRLKKELSDAESDYKKAQSAQKKAAASAGNINNYLDKSNPINNIVSANYDSSDDHFTLNQAPVMYDDEYAGYYSSEEATEADVFYKDGTYYTRALNPETGAYDYTPIENPDTDNYIQETNPVNFYSYDASSYNYIQNMIANGALSEDFDPSNAFVHSDDSGNIVAIAFRDQLQDIIDKGKKTYTPYSPTKVDELTSTLADAKEKLTVAETALQEAQDNFSNPDITSIELGNEVIDPIQGTEFDVEQIKQIIRDTGSTNLSKYIDSDGNYVGNGIYTYNYNGVDYYVAYDDLVNSYLSTSATQTKLPTYAVKEAPADTELSSKAYIELDENGQRLNTIRLAGDNTTRELTATEQMDEQAYNDAIRAYEYEQAYYDKRQEEIGAMTSILHQEDLALDLRMASLETQRTALKTEIETVQKVLKENVERSFKTFGN